MTATNMQWWPRHMLRAVSSSFTLGSLNGQVQPIFSARPRAFSDPLERRWFCTFQSPPMGEKETTFADDNDAKKYQPSFREAQGRIRKMRGQIGTIRVFDQFAKEPQYNQYHGGTESKFSDGSTFSDGSKWIGGFLPPFITVDEAATTDAMSIVVRGLPVSIDEVFRIDDRFEIEPNGIRTTYTHYYGVDDVCRSDASGKTRINFSPGLSSAVNPGDAIRLKYPTAVMAAVDDKQGELQRGLVTGSFGITLVGVLRSD